MEKNKFKYTEINNDIITIYTDWNTLELPIREALKMCSNILENVENSINFKLSSNG